MARTNRAEALAKPPSASVDALDDLNLDDMFEDGDDTLFDGLDIDLDGMGDIVSSPNTKKAGVKISQDLDAMKVDLLGDGAPAVPTVAPAAATPPAKRRKTKRKIKAPPPPDDDEDEDYELPTKKKRKKGTSKKKSTAKKASDAGSPSKSKAKSKAAASAMLPPYARGSSDGMVAAAGQFGGRQQKKGAYAPTLSRQSSKSKSKSTPSPASSVSLGDPSLSKARRTSSGSQSDGPWPQAESTFCGLRPSNNDFYPFLSAVPPEAAMKRGNRMYPVIDKIHSLISSSSAPSASAPAQESDPLFRLLLADLDLHHTDRSNSQASHMQRRVALGQSVPAARQLVSQADRNQLLGDLQSVCVLLKRQYDFLHQNLENMERWCRDHFTPEDYLATYGTTAPGMQRPVAKPILASIKAFVIKIKIKCPGFKAPKGAGQLYAQIRTPPPVVSTKSDTSKSSAATRKKKPSTTKETDKTSVSGVSVPEIVEETPYAKLKPWQRRQRVAEAVALRAQSLELQHRETTDRHNKALERQYEDLAKVVKNDEEHVSLNTQAMWMYLVKSAYFMDHTEADIRELIETMWEPEVCELSDSPQKPIQPRPKPQKKSSGEGRMDSYVFRLQSLLVEEGSDDDEEDSDDDDDLLFDSVNAKLGDSSENRTTTVVDLSRLNQEERAFIHLRAAGLLDDSSVLSMQPYLIEESDALPTKETLSVPEQDMNGEKLNEKSMASEQDLVSVIQSMQAGLLAQRRLNNSRVAFLESTARLHLETIRQQKKKEDENASVYSKYKQLATKQKDAKKSARQKPVKKDGDWVPW